MWMAGIREWRDLEGGVTHGAVTAPAIVHGKRHHHVAGAAKVTVDVAVHGEGFGGFPHDVEDVRVATGAVKPLKMILMGETDVAAR